jgi:hypothetical protein
MKLASPVTPQNSSVKTRYQSFFKPLTRILSYVTSPNHASANIYFPEVFQCTVRLVRIRALVGV